MFHCCESSFHSILCRTKSGVLPPLATRATLAAWPPNGVNAVEPTNDLISQNSAPLRADERGCLLFVCFLNQMQ